jgi:hypothetical protein
MPHHWGKQNPDLEGEMSVKVNNLRFTDQQQGHQQRGPVSF